MSRKMRLRKSNDATKTTHGKLSQPTELISSDPDCVKVTVRLEQNRKNLIEFFFCISESLVEIYKLVSFRREFSYRTNFILVKSENECDECPFDETITIGSMLSNKNNKSLDLILVDKPYTYSDLHDHIRRIYSFMFPKSYCEYSYPVQEDFQIVNTVLGISENDVTDEMCNPTSTPPTILPDTKKIISHSYLIEGDSNIWQPFQSLSNLCFLKKEKESLISCVQDFSISGWNPPPHQRKLAGDLLYLEVVTLERNSYCITCNSDGFFVNASTVYKFNHERTPGVAKTTFITLYELMTVISGSFASNFDVQVHQCASSVDHLPVMKTIPSWICYNKQHSRDSFRSIKSYCGIVIDDGRMGQMRDWNDEYQVIRTLPQGTREEILFKSKLMYKFFYDFISTVRAGTVAICNNEIHPINQSADQKLRMFVWNNIFFTHAVDLSNVFTHVGGDEAAHVTTMYDIRGIDIIDRLCPKDIHTVLAAIVDYGPHRVAAQVIVPGVMQSQDEDILKYGYIDSITTVRCDPKFNEVIKQFIKPLRIRPQKILNGESGEDEITLNSSVEAKGLAGRDGRSYLVDLIRLLPMDANFLLPSNDFYDVSNISLLGQGPSTFPLCLSNDDIEYKHQIPIFREEFMYSLSEGDLKTADLDPDFTFSPDCFLRSLRRNEDEMNNIKTDQITCWKLSQFLLCHKIPQVVQQLEQGLIFILDGTTLTNILHRHGINMRYLGEMYNKFSLPYLKALCLNEMIVRATKSVYRKIFKNVPSQETSEFVSSFLNSFLFSSQIQSSDRVENGKLKAKWTESVDSTSLFIEICERMTKCFLFTSKCSSLEEIMKLEPLLTATAVLRNFCIKCGIQLKLRDLNKSKANKNVQYFKPCDILQLVPIVKTINNSSCAWINSEIESYTSFIDSFCGLIDITEIHNSVLELLRDMENIKVCLDEDYVKIYQILSKIHGTGQNQKMALKLHIRSILIAEKTCGFDHPITINSYIAMARFMKYPLCRPLVLNSLLHAKYLISLVFGPSHPTIAKIDLHLFHLIQLYNPQNEKVKENVLNVPDDEAITLLRKTISFLRTIRMDKSMLMAVCIRKMVKLTIPYDMRRSLNLERECFEILSQIYEKDHEYVKSSSYLIERMTKSVVCSLKATTRDKPKPINGHKEHSDSITTDDRPSSQLEVTSSTSIDVNAIIEMSSKLLIFDHLV